MNQERKRIVVFMVVVALLAGSFSSFGWGFAKAAGPDVMRGDVADYDVSSPRKDSKGISTWDCIWFGNYWQEDTNGDGKADKNDEKTPIRWRVLSVEGDDAFLLSERCLDYQDYNTRLTEVTWETSTVRSWLNGYGEDQNAYGANYSSDNFIKDAFTSEEQKALLITDVVNDDNGVYRTPGGNDTKDQVYLLSEEEIRKPEYGFGPVPAAVSDMAGYNSMARATAFAEGQGAYIWAEGYEGYTSWWLRSPGTSSVYAMLVNVGGAIHDDGSAVSAKEAIRPALHVNLAALTGDSYAGTVNSKGETGSTPSPQATVTPSAQVTETPSAEPEKTTVPTLTYDLKVKTEGNGTLTLKTGETTITTDGNASVDMKINSGDDVLFTFQPAEGSPSYTLTVDGKEQQVKGNSYRIAGVQESHTVVVTFAAPATPSPEPESPAPTEPVTPSPSVTPEPSGTPVPQPSLSPGPDEDISAIGDALGVSPDTAAKIQAAARELNVSMDTLLVTEQTIQSQKDDRDIKGAYFGRLQARASRITENNIKLSWNRVKGADGYEVYGNRCNTKKWIYKYKKKKVIKNGRRKSYIDRKCKKGTYYKYIVRAYKIIDGKKVTIAASKTIHVTTNGGKNGNAKNVKVNRNKVSIRMGKTWRLRASEVRDSKPLRHHREVSYESSHPQALSVSGKGVIRAKKKGKYTVFAYAQSGVYKKVRVTVK